VFGRTAAWGDGVYIKRLIVVVGCLLGASACDEANPAGPSVGLDQQFTLAPGESASIQRTSLRIAFLQVSGDSRCPADVLCIQGGDAIVHVRATGMTAGDYELHTGDQARAVATHAGFHIGLLQLQPYPFSSRPIQPAEYRATFTVTR
jgi:hypothetical protein